MLQRWLFGHWAWAQVITHVPQVRLNNNFLELYEQINFWLAYLLYMNSTV